MKRSTINAYMEAVAVDLAEMIIEEKCSLRQLGEKTGISHTTIYHKFTKILPTVDTKLHKKVRKILNANKYNKNSIGFKVSK